MNQYYLHNVKRIFSWAAGSLLAGCLLCQAADQPGVGLKLVAEGLVSPSFITSLPDGSGRMLISDQIGVIYLLNKDGKLAETPFLDLRQRIIKLNQGFDERGLLSLALHPKFTQNHKIYVTYSAPREDSCPTNWDNTIHISEFKCGESTAEPSSEKIVFRINKPYFNHNGGALAFGPDGYLYISVGDGGNANDEGIGHAPHGNGQDLTTVLGKILRIDVDKGNPYAVPSDNPFQDGKGRFRRTFRNFFHRKSADTASQDAKSRPEIYAYGLRNPWRITFDRGGSHELFTADVGQDLFEEVDIIVKGGNYGWNVREGFHCFNPKDNHTPPENCPDKGADGKPFIDPILEYKNLNRFQKDPEAKGTSTVGGYVYRGKAFPALTRRYVFADWSKYFVKPDGALLVATRPSDGSKKWALEYLELSSPAKIGAYVVGLGQDADGELYVLTNASNLIGKTGKVYKIVPI